MWCRSGRFMNDGWGRSRSSGRANYCGSRKSPSRITQGESEQSCASEKDSSLPSGGNGAATELYCSPDWVSFTAQEGFAAPPDTLQFWPFTDPAPMVEKYMFVPPLDIWLSITIALVPPTALGEVTQLEVEEPAVQVEGVVSEDVMVELLTYPSVVLPTPKNNRSVVPL